MSFAGHSSCSISAIGMHVGPEYFGINICHISIAKVSTWNTVINIEGNPAVLKHY